MSNERKARGWSQAEAVRALRAHSSSELPSHEGVLRQWKRWESGEVQPKEFYQPVIAAMFGTVTHAMFPVAPQRDPDTDVLAMAGMDTLELVSRLQRSDPEEPSGTRANQHPHVHGANLGFRASAYLRASGFPALPTAEDHALVAALAAGGCRVLRTRALPVVTSARRDSRAPDGSGHYLRKLEATPA
jgi:hypothetical protein